METSSPLATMHRPASIAGPPPPPVFAKRELFANVTNIRVRLSPGKLPASKANGPANSKAAALALRNGLNQDYFGFKPVHGSSPAGSLAADLCQNFTIGDDGSPRFPTPRRALFTTAHPGERRGFTRPPPLPISSSPLPVDDFMDMTPVKPKARVSAIVQRQQQQQQQQPPLPSSPLSSPCDQAMLLESPCPTSSQPPVVDSRPPSSGLMERRKPLRRASLTRAKGHSFAGPSGRLHSENQLPFFRFGGDTRFVPAPPAPPPLSAASSSLSLAECFQDSPPPQRALVDVVGASAAPTTLQPSVDSLPETAPQPQSPSPLPSMAAVAPPPAMQAPQAPHLMRSRSSFLSMAAARSGSPVFGIPGSSGFNFGSNSSTSGGTSLGSSSSCSSTSGSSSGPSSVSGGNGHIRRTSSSVVRPRRHYRRSLSMFENSGDILKPKQRGGGGGGGNEMAVAATLQPSLLSSVMDTDEPAMACTATAGASAAATTASAASPILPHFFAEGQNDMIPRIDRATLLAVLDGKYNDRFDEKLIIDCRFEYEYDGGHICEAVNVNDKDLLATQLFAAAAAGATGGGNGSSSSSSMGMGSNGQRTLIVLHCEYSAHRAPLMARHIRAEDRAVNCEHYPRLTFPELYILDGGYSGFFGNHPGRCYPQAYVEMDAKEHAFACERQMGRLRQNRKGLHRAQTFAFGTHSAGGAGGSGSPGTALAAAVHVTLSAPAATAVAAAAGTRPAFHFNELSPTAGRRPDDSPVMMMGASPILGSDRRHARRMASY